MAVFFVVSLLIVFALVLFSAFLNASPASIANFLKRTGPILMMAVGAALLFIGRAGIGMPLLLIGGSWVYRQRGISKMSGGSNAQTSTVRSAWLEMQLDHDTGDLEGEVLTGPLEGEFLSNLDETTLMDLYANLRGDAESAGLMEAYLDRRIPLWREHTQGSAGSGEGHAASAGPMSKQEAYQILGLSERATAAEIKAAHRRLMKAVHPDTNPGNGGSTFLAARINEAKDMLLD